MHVGQADWDAQWRGVEIDFEAPLKEQETARWLAQAVLVERLFGGFSGLRVIELGAGRGINGLLYARAGANVTLLDKSAVALDQARELYARYGVEVTLLEADLFKGPPPGSEPFDLSMSFGLCEHFLGGKRTEVVRKHIDFVRTGGVAMIGVPNKWAPAYRAWMGVLKRRGTWTLGTEEPFSVSELRRIASEIGGAALEPAYGSFLASLVSHGLNQAQFKLGYQPSRIPQRRIPVLDRFAYELLVPIVRVT